MARTDMDHALTGYDGRIVYADAMTSRLYAMTTREVRREVRRMITGEWQGSRDLSPRDLVDGAGIVSATLRISDCVARCRVDFGSGPDAVQMVVESNEIRIPGGLPDTIVGTLRGRDMGDVAGHPMLRGVRVGHVRSARDPLVLLWDDMPGYIHDAEGLAEDAAGMADAA